MMNTPIGPHDGKLLILTPGLGAVATTLIAGVEAIRRGLARPIGSLTQMQSLPPRGGAEEPRAIRELLPLAPLADLEFAAWDIFADDAYASACRAGVLDRQTLAPLEEALRQVRPMPAAFSRDYVRRLDGPRVKRSRSKRGLAEALRQDIRDRLAESGATRAVMVWCGSTEVHLRPRACHRDIAAFEAGLDASDPGISPSQLYAYAAIQEGVPYANGAPNLSADVPALEELARSRQVPIAGKDFKTGQTLLKTVLAPGIKARSLGVAGWFSTNILGNRDGEVLDDPDSFRAKEVTKSGVLEALLDPNASPGLYDEVHHRVRINYYRPRGDAKESWDNVDIFGWLDQPMQIKVNFLCRDSILAAPLVLDLALLLDLAGRAKIGGIQEWLSFYFKCPQVPEGALPEHDLFRQHQRLILRLGELVRAEQGGG